MIVRALLVDDQHMKAVIDICEIITMIKKRRKESGGRQTLPAGTPERRGDVALFPLYSNEREQDPLKKRIPRSCLRILNCLGKTLRRASMFRYPRLGSGLRAISVSPVVARGLFHFLFHIQKCPRVKLKADLPVNTYR